MNTFNDNMKKFSNDIFLNIGKKFNEIIFEIMQKFEIRDRHRTLQRMQMGPRPDARAATRTHTRAWTESGGKKSRFLDVVYNARGRSLEVRRPNSKTKSAAQVENHLLMLNFCFCYKTKQKPGKIIIGFYFYYT